MMRRLIRLVWALYPARFQRRFATELQRDLRLRRDATGVAQLVDALVTLLRLWALETRRLLRWDAPFRDLRLALRGVRHAPGYSLLVVAILALALGGNTAVFSVTHAVLLKGLPYGAPDRVFDVSPVPQISTDEGWFVAPDFSALEQVEAVALYVDGGGANLSRDGAGTHVSLAQVTEDFFPVLGVDALIGSARMTRNEREIVLSHAFWVQAFGAARDIVGRDLELNGRSYRIAGVVPAGVAFPSPVDLWLPFPTDAGFYASAYGPSGVVRLVASGDVDVVAGFVGDRTRARYAEMDRNPPGTRLTGLREQLTGGVRTPLVVLLSIAALLVLLGCFNLAGVVLSRNGARLHELRMRRALGAGRWRLFRQLFIEVVVLATFGGLASVVAATMAAGLLRRMLPGATPGLDGVAINAPVLGFAAAITAVAALFVGLLPALQGAFVGEQPRGLHTATGDRRNRRAQGVLVVGQVALAFGLVVGATLLSRSLRNLEAVPLGYDLERVLTFQVRLPEAAYPDDLSRAAYLRDMKAGLRGQGEIVAVGATSYLPQEEAMFAGLFLGRPDADDAEGELGWLVKADRDYFRAIGIPVLQGRLFDEPGADAIGRDRLVITRRLADSLFPEGGVVAGRTVTLRSRVRIDARIEAVVGDVRLGDQRSRPDPVVYTDLERAPSAFLGFAVRASADPAALADSVRSVAAEIDPEIAPFNLATTAQAAARQIAVESALARLSLIFSASALLLTALGLYGLVSQGIVQRRRELGIRLALGARRTRLLRGVIALPLRLTLAGLLAGLSIALVGADQLTPLLFEVAPRDPWLLAGVGAVVTGVAILAALLSGRAALALDPAEALRAE
ncbi:MAG: ABC transporter permease [Acidobacteriota bacterium]|jgi:predicted permease